MGPGWLLNAGAKNEMGTVLGQGQTVNSMTIISNTIRSIKTQQFNSIWDGVENKRYVAGGLFATTPF